MNDDDLYDVDGDARDCEDDGDGDGDVWCAEEFGVCQSLCPVTECDGAVGEVGRWGTEKHRQLIRFIHNTWPAGNVVNIVDVCDQCKTICWKNMILEHVFQIWSSQFSFPRSLYCEFVKTLPLIATLKIMRKKTWVYVVAGAAVIVIFILVVVDVGIKN